MPKLNLRRYDVQAKVSLVLSLASILFVAGVFVALFMPSGSSGGFNWEEKTIAYRSGSPRWFLLVASAGLATTLSLIGLSFGANSAGQRRNDKQKHSWIGFFTGTGVLTLVILLLTFFLLRGDRVP